MLKMMRRHWVGESGFWTSFLVCTLLLAAIVFYVGLTILGNLSPDLHPTQRMWTGTIVFLAIPAFGIWQLVGTWRASSSVRAGEHYRLTRWLARGTALAIGLAALAMLAALPTLVGRLYDMANDKDQFGLAGNSVETDGTNLLISGYFSWGLLTRAENALAENPGIDTVILNSPGGHSAVGRKLAALFKAHHLNTAVVEFCGSACTFAFAGGERRLASPRARIGFHAEASENPQTLKLSREISHTYWKEFGLPPDFIEKVNATPPEDVWYPSLSELKRLNFVTEVIR